MASAFAFLADERAFHAHLYDGERIEFTNASMAYDMSMLSIMDESMVSVHEALAAWSARTFQESS